MAEVSYRAVVRELAAGSEARALSRLERWPIPPPEMTVALLKKTTRWGGTSGSNPFCSSGESIANLFDPEDVGLENAPP